MWGQMPELTATIAACAGARPGRAGERLSLSRGTEQSFEHHPTLGARRRLTRSNRTVEGTLAAQRLENEISHGIPARTGTTTTRRPATGKECCWSVLQSQVKQFEGKRMSEVIRALDKPPIDVLFELLENNNGSVRPCTSIIRRTTCVTR